MPKIGYVADHLVIKGLQDWINKSIDFTPINIKQIELEELPKANPAMALFAEPGTYKEIITIAGDFDVYFRFRVDFRGTAEDTKDRTGLLQPFHYLADFFDIETRNKRFGELHIGEGRKPISVSMDSLPSKVAVDANKITTYTAFYQLKYEQETQLWTRKV